MNNENIKQFDEKKKKRGSTASLLQLWPALLVGILVSLSIGKNQPVLASIPEKLVYEAPEIDITQESTASRPQSKRAEEAEEASELPAADVSYPDGVYVGSARGYGGTIKVQVTVQNGRITGVEILGASGETDAYLELAKSLIDTVLRRQTYEVDGVSGATYSSRGILGAIKNALTGEKVHNEAAPTTPEPVGEIVLDSFEEPSAYTDGVYEGSGTGFGGTISVRVTISEGRLADIQILSAAGETASYLSMAEGVIDRILAAGTPEVDAVSGATYSSRGIINAVIRALAGAAAADADPMILPAVEPETEPSAEAEPEEKCILADVVLDPQTQVDVTDKTYQDGVYLGTGAGFGGAIQMEVTIKEGVITRIRVVSADSETPAYFNRAIKTMDTMLSSQSSEVDAISGATFSSGGISEAVWEALNQAAQKDKEPGGESGEDPDENHDQDSDKEPDEGFDEGPDNESKKPKYIDGTYTVVLQCTDDEEFDYDVQIVCTIELDRLVSVVPTIFADRSWDPSGNRFYFNLACNGRTIKGIFHPGIPAAAIEKQGTDIDAVSGATYSSNAIKNGIAQLLLEAERPNENTAEEEIEED